VIFGEVTTGAENDLERATILARQMVCIYGMNEVIGLPHTAHRSHSYLGHDAPMQKDCSEETAREVDIEVKKILERCYWEAREILQTQREHLEHVTNVLLKEETIDGDAFYQLIGRTPPQRRSTETTVPAALDPTPQLVPANKVEPQKNDSSPPR
jgi:cell division protease FtsH